MVKRTVINEYVELSNLENGTCCGLNIFTNQKEFFSWKEMKRKKSEGFYYFDEKIFFALMESKNGPMIFYEGEIYPLNKNLSIDILKKDKNREFFIEEYGIHINYFQSKYIGFDSWSNEEDVDLFYLIYISYKNDNFYKKYTV